MADKRQEQLERALLGLLPLNGNQWVAAVNAKGGFGSWCWDVAFQPAQLQDILQRHVSAGSSAVSPLVLA